jgi:two-component system sensor kinase FixL
MQLHSDVRIKTNGGRYGTENVKWSGRVDSLIPGLSLVAGLRSMARFGTALPSGVVMTGVIAAYVLLEWVSFIHEYKGVPITPWNPGLGLVFGFMVLSGARYTAVLFVGAVIAEIAVLRSDLWWPIILGLAAIIAGGYGVVATMARRTMRLDAGLNRLRDVVLLMASGVVGAVLVAVFMCLLLLADQKLDLADVLVAAGPLLIGDIIGIAVITPLTLRLALHPQSLLDHVSLRMLLELLLFVAVVIAALWVIVAAGPNGSKLFYLMFLPVVVAAVRYGLDGACIGVAVTQLALVGLLHHHGYEVNVFAEFQLLMLVLSTTGLTVGVVVTERRHADETVRAVERQLKAKEVEAAQAARFNLVSGTAAALAHEINQPMTAARALARSVQQLLHGPVPNLARIETNIGNLIIQIDHAGGVVRRMREFLRRGRPHSSTIAMRELLTDALALARAAAVSRGVSIALDAPDNLPVVHGDAVQLQQVVLNLVRNAEEAIADARTPNGHITVVARRLEAPARVEISIVDNGPGIAAEVVERLFHPLTTSKTDGLGLGLSISASIVEAHGGRIWVQTGKAGATEFRFSLPLETG